MADTILVVDDDVGVQLTLETMLESEGYDVVVATDGLDALAKLEARRPRVILLDWGMPRMDATAFAARLQQQGLHPGIPILLLTADGRPREKAARINADGYLGKPFAMDDLLGEIARLAAS